MVHTRDVDEHRCHTRTGRIRQYWPNGRPSYLWPSTTRPVTVYLHDRSCHHGQPYFAKMRWTWTNAHGEGQGGLWLVSNGSGRPGASRQ